MLDFSVYSEVEQVTIKYKNITSFSIFFSASTTQTFLKNQYLFHQIDQAEQKSYENCYRLMYLLKHGQLYYEQAKIAPLALKPTLIFYGLVHFIKACILTVYPTYPETTTMLAHGVSTRKRKKQQYDFFQDEVKCQKNGLLSVMTEHMFHVNKLEGTKLTMQQLFEHIPELNDLFYFYRKKNTFLKMEPIDQQTFSLNKNVILDRYHMTENRFIHYIESKYPETILFKKSTNGTQLILQIKKIDSLTNSHRVPFKFHMEEKQYFFPLQQHFLSLYPEIITHYLLLYNLSMIARYETEWWSELIHTMPNHDFPFIESFLELTIEKSPMLLFDYLLTNVNIS